MRGSAWRQVLDWTALRGVEKWALDARDTRDGVEQRRRERMRTTMSRLID